MHSYNFHIRLRPLLMSTIDCMGGSFAGLRSRCRSDCRFWGCHSCGPGKKLALWGRSTWGLLLGVVATTGSSCTAAVSLEQVAFSGTRSDAVFSTRPCAGKSSLLGRCASHSHIYGWIAGNCRLRFSTARVACRTQALTIQILEKLCHTGVFSSGFRRPKRGFWSERV